MSLNLEDVQDYIVSRIASDPDLEGTIVVADDGSYPKTPGREEALAKDGLVIIVDRVQFAAALDIQSDSGLFYNIHIDVVAEENQQISRGPSGKNIRIEKAIRLVLERVAGTSEGSGGGQQAFMPIDPPGEFLGTVQGINRAVVTFSKLFSMQPDLSP